MTAATLRALLLLPVCLAPAQQAQFASIPPVATDALHFAAPLAEFEAKDIAGRTWRTEDLRGKYTVVCIWYTFAARSVDRLDPHSRSALRNLLVDLGDLQRFYDETRTSPNLQLLTFCSDYDYTHAPEYMKEKKYTFPVIADWVLAKRLFQQGDDVRVVNPEGRLSEPQRYESLGHILFEVERAAGRK